MCLARIRFINILIIMTVKEIRIVRPAFILEWIWERIALLYRLIWSVVYLVIQQIGAWPIMLKMSVALPLIYKILFIPMR